MSWILAGVTFIGSVVACLALWYVSVLTKQVRRLQRQEYYTEQKLKGVTTQIAEALEPLRVHLATLAMGASIPVELIRDGRLYREMSAEEAEDLISSGLQGHEDQLLVLDVRMKKEYEAKHVPGAKLIPIEELEKRYQKEIPYTVSKVLVYCAAGDRSRLACDFLSRQGYTNLFHIRGGFQGWNGPVEGNRTVNFIQIEPKTRVSSSK